MEHPDSPITIAARYGGGRIVVGVAGFVLHRPDGTTREGSAEQLERDDATRLDVCQAMDVASLVEARVALIRLKEGKSGVQVEPKFDRPAITYSDGFGRGNPFGWWLLGRVLRVSNRTGGGDLAIEDVAARGIPTAIELPDGLRASAARAAAQRAPLACACGTGAPSAMMHGSVRTLAYAQHPAATVEVNAMVGECLVCGARIVFTSEGDTSYEVRDASHWSRV